MAVNKALAAVFTAIGITVCFNGVNNAFAEQVKLNEPSVIGNKVEISGTLGENNGGKDVTVQVISPGCELGSLSDVFYMIQIESSADGSFEHIMTMPEKTINGEDATGIYKVYAGAKGMEPSGLTGIPDSEMYIESFYYITAQKRTELINVISSADNADDILKLLNAQENERILRQTGMLLDAFRELTEVRQQRVCENLTKADFKGEEAFSSAVNGFIMLEYLNADLSSADKMMEALRAFASLVSIDYAQYDSLTESGRAFFDAQLMKAANGKAWLSITDFEKRAGELLILSDINSVAVYKEIWSVIEKYIDYIQFAEADLSYYKSLTDEDKIYKINKALTKQNFTSTDELKNAFSKAVSDVKASDKAGGSGSGSGGSGSSGSGGGSAAVAAAPKNGTSVAGGREQTVFFSDVPESHWAYPSIKALKESGVVDGNEKGDFEPEQILTREIFVKMLAAGLRLPEVRENPGFEDVSESDWYYPYVASAYKVQLIRGVNKNRFGAGEEITRQDMVVMIYRAAKYMGIALADEDTDSFFDDDADIALYAREAIYSLRNSGMVNGISEKEFAPKALSTKAQAAWLIYSLTEARQLPGKTEDQSL